MPPSPSLAAITMLARSGALDLAWRRFEAGGFAADDPAALTVRGRLLKDRALRASGGAQRALYRAAAEAYARAAGPGEATYPLINAATLALLSGDRAMAQALAERTLARLDSSEQSGEPDGETPYYHRATRAEALLLTGRIDAARTAFAAAVAVAPLAHEDHASTLRQFALVLDALGEDAAWLDVHRPPRRLHFAGRMGAPDDAAAINAMRGRIAAILAAERIGAGHGALAAGADIIIAEALLAHGAALHVVLPAPSDAFIARSVTKYGAAWRARFDAALAAAASVHVVCTRADPVDDECIAFGSEMAMGRAALAAASLATEAVQLLVTDPAGDGGDNTARDAEVWRHSGRRQHILHWPAASPRAEPAPEAAPPPEPGLRPRYAPAALLYVELAEAHGDTLPGGFTAALQAIHAVFATLAPPIEARTTVTGVRLAYAEPAEAATVAAAIHASLDAAMGTRIGGHFAIAAHLADPFSGQPALFGSEPARAARIAALTTAGATYVSEDFVAGLLARDPVRFRCEYVGDAPAEPGADEMRLFALKPGGR